MTVAPPPAGTAPLQGHSARDRGLASSQRPSQHPTDACRSTSAGLPAGWRTLICGSGHPRRSSELVGEVGGRPVDCREAGGRGRGRIGGRRFKSRASSPCSVPGSRKPPCLACTVKRCPGWPDLPRPGKRRAWSRR